LVLEKRLDESVNVTNGDLPAKNLLRPILVVLLIFLAIGCVLVAVRRAEADRRARMATLPDGSKLELLGTAARARGESRTAANQSSNRRRTSSQAPFFTARRLDYSDHFVNGESSIVLRIHGQPGRCADHKV
jgi:hypothetical protein